MIENKLYRKLISARNYLDEIKTVDFYNQSCVLAIDSYKKFIQYFVDHFGEIEESTYKVLFIFISTRFIPSVRYIERASTANIPWSVIPYLDRMLKEQFGTDYLLLFRPQWHFNYSVMTDDLIRPLSNVLLTIFPTRAQEISSLFSTQKIHVFSFPYLEKTNVLLYSVIGHELGHFYHNRWKETPEAKKLILDQNVHLSTYYRKKFPADLFRPYEKTIEGMKILEGMYREILSDICGYLIFGPSMLFALDFISIFEGKIELPSRFTNYYPPIKYRIRVLYEEILKIDGRMAPVATSKSECSKYYKRYLQDIEQYLSDNEDQKALTDIAEEIKLFKASLPDIISYAQSQVPKYYLNPNQIDELYLKLDDIIPANELHGKPVGMADIILAGWIYYQKIDQISKGDEFITNYQILMRLLLKSLFSSYVDSEYQNSKGPADEHLV